MTSTTSTTQDLPAMLANMSAASLFVGELLPHVNEVTLYRKFATMGTVTSVKLCRDWVTGKSLCYAYVNFENPAEAEKAYRSLNYELLDGHPMRIMKSTRNPWLQKDGDCSCYHHHCCGNNKGFIDAKTLVEAIENYSAAFKTLAIQDSGETKAPTGYKYSSEFLKRMNIANNRFTNVFIKNFKDLLDDFKLWKLCKQFGEVTSAKVMVDEYGISKGFGFACFTDSDSAQRAVNKLNGLVLDGRTLYAGPAITKTQRQRDCNVRYDNDDYKTEWRQSINLSNACSLRIRIRNLRDVVDEVRLRKEFERFGPVVHAELLKTCDGRSKGTGYVVYQEQQDATKALTSMHGKVIYGTRISVTYAPYITSTTATNTVADSSLITTSANTTAGSGGNNTTTNSNATNDGDNKSNKNFLQLKDLVSTLANKGHPVNINDISTFNSSVNRNSSNNTENINTSNNAILVRSARKMSEQSESAESGDGDLKHGDDDSGDDMTTTTATLSVKNLDESITDEKLESLFSVYGHVLSAKVISNEFGVSKGFGFVIMSDAQDAVRAIKNLDGRIVVNRPVYVAPTAQARLSAKM